MTRLALDTQIIHAQGATQPFFRILHFAGSQAMCVFKIIIQVELSSLAHVWEIGESGILSRYLTEIVWCAP